MPNFPGWKGNKNYVRGRRKEYRIVNAEKAKGCISFRSAGSHSPIDVISIDTIKKEIRFIQSKPDSMSEKGKLRLQELYSSINGTYKVEFKVI